MGKPWRRPSVGCRQLLSGAGGASGAGVRGRLPGLGPSLQPEEEERYAAVRLRLPARVRRLRTGPAAAGKTSGES